MRKVGEDNLLVRRDRKIAITTKIVPNIQSVQEVVVPLEKIKKDTEMKNRRMSKELSAKQEVKSVETSKKTSEGGIFDLWMEKVVGDRAKYAKAFDVFISTIDPTLYRSSGCKLCGKFADCGFWLINKTGEYGETIIKCPSYFKYDWEKDVE